ncbi:MAG: hypothetical protein LM513_03905 [Nitrospira sp.]|nr:hypothetical protein [Nitrospira sp.]
MNANLKKAFAAIIVVGALTSANAQAEGFIAGLLRDTGVINENQRKELDGIHEKLGRPLDHATSQVVDVYMPGAGTAMEANWAYQRQRAQQANYEQQRAQQAYYEQQRAQQAYYHNVCRQRGFYGYNPNGNTCY